MVGTGPSLAIRLTRRRRGLIQPSLTIMDVSNAFAGDCLIGGDDIVEMDRYIVRRLRLSEPRYLKVLADYPSPPESQPVVHGDQAVPLKGLNWREEEYQSLFNLRLWSNPSACSMCRLRFHELMTLKKRRVLDIARIYLKLIKLALTGADIVFGSKPSYMKRGKPLVCMGDCTRPLAEREQARYIPGCPPTIEQIAKHL